MSYKFFALFSIFCIMFVIEFGQSNGQPNRICRLPIETGACPGRFPRYAYVVRQRSCQRFIWTGCEGNSNSFDTKLKCEDYCRGIQ
ncbi:trypsin inhibitor-like [Leptopilina boulardi]|uniref:trypsin inhibitor-like n=1 Tax=Leptopilina boulardi TaxID=63433 RepID=UPI0021F6197C|nr:trypsin inhibitor-like [Leptopilina boulardi]